MMFFGIALIALMSVVAFMAFSVGKIFGRKCAIKKAWANPTIPSCALSRNLTMDSIAKKHTVHGTTKGESYGKPSNEEVSAKTTEAAGASRA